MQNPFWSSAVPRFANREEIIGLASQTARQIGEGYPHVLKVLLIGSFARGDYGARSDLDLLVILKTSNCSVPERLDELLKYTPAFPTDILPLTQEEVETRFEMGDPFIRRALREGILLWSGDCP
jgi:predicted nucleotidyltransferase